MGVFEDCYQEAKNDQETELECSDDYDCCCKMIIQEAMVLGRHGKA